MIQSVTNSALTKVERLLHLLVRQIPADRKLITRRNVVMMHKGFYDIHRSIGTRYGPNRSVSSITIQTF